MMHRGKVFWFEYRSQYAMENYHIALGSLANRTYGQTMPDPLEESKRTYGLTMPDPAGGIKCLVEVMVLIKRFQNKSKYSHSNQIHKKLILAKRVTFGYKMLIPLKKFILWLNRG